MNTEQMRQRIEDLELENEHLRSLARHYPRAEAALSILVQSEVAKWRREEAVRVASEHKESREPTPAFEWPTQEEYEANNNGVRAQSDARGPEAVEEEAWESNVMWTLASDGGSELDLGPMPLNEGPVEFNVRRNPLNNAIPWKP